MTTQGAGMPQGLPSSGGTQHGCSALQRKEDARRRAEEEKERMKQVKMCCSGGSTRVMHVQLVLLSPYPCPSLRSWPRHPCVLGQGPARQVFHPCAAAAGADAEGGGGCHPPGDPGRADGAAGGRCR